MTELEFHAHTQYDPDVTISLWVLVVVVVCSHALCLRA